MQSVDFLKYRDFLQEKINMHNIAWHEESIYFAVRGYLPITTKIGKEFYDNRVDCFHITGLRDLDNFKHLIGKKKSISAFTQMSQHTLMSTWGIQTPFDVLLHIDGNLLINSQYDIMSAPDENGRRWISINELKPKQQSKEFTNDHQKLLSLAETKFGENYSYDLVYDDNIDKKKKAEFISWWVAETEKFILKHKNEIITLLGSLSNKSTSSWDELLVNDIKIKNAVLIIQDDGYFEETVMRLFGSNEYLEKKLKSFVDGEIFITKKRLDVVNFVKENGGTIITNYI